LKKCYDINRMPPINQFPTGRRYLSIITRFAPSPTGELHLGGLRTALYSFALANHNQRDNINNNSKFLLRIEDTDQSRTVPGSEDRIIKALHQCGLIPANNNNTTPIRQSDRLPLYQKIATTLLQSGHAYRCFCSRERLDRLRKSQKEIDNTGTKYDGKCLSLSQEEIDHNLKENKSYTVRLKSSNQSQRILVKDLVLGDVWFPPESMDDQILLKADGWPTYHLASVVDDHDMRITHVVRGDEWLSSTPKHLLLYEAMGWNPPLFAHLPLLLTSDGKKLSKRSAMGMPVLKLLEDGYLPSTLLNFCALLGWSPPPPPSQSIIPSSNKQQHSKLSPEQQQQQQHHHDGKVLTLDDICNEFTLDRVTKGGAIMDENRLFWLNSMHIRRVISSYNDNNKESFLPPQLEYKMLCNHVMNGLRKELPTSSIDTTVDLNYLHQVMNLLKERVIMPNDFVRLGAHFFIPHQQLDKQVLINAKPAMEQQLHGKKILHEAIQLITNTNDFHQLETLHDHNTNLAGLRKRDVLTILRWALTGLQVGAPIGNTALILGKERVLERLKMGLELL
jgi:glutamyl/glutaminyl-tRNA synthetase